MQGVMSPGLATRIYTIETGGHRFRPHSFFLIRMQVQPGRLELLTALWGVIDAELALNSLQDGL